jgi:hypothetical protein
LNGLLDIGGSFGERGLWATAGSVVVGWLRLLGGDGIFGWVRLSVGFVEPGVFKPSVFGFTGCPGVVTGVGSTPFFGLVG